MLNDSRNLTPTLNKESEKKLNNNTDDIIDNNIVDDNDQIPQTSPVYKYCKSLKELNLLNENGWSPIYRAIIANDLPALKELLKMGAEPNTPNNLGETPLYLCVENKNYDALMILLENGANPNIQKRNGDTPLHLCFKKKLENKFICGLLKHKANPNIFNKL